MVFLGWKSLDTIENYKPQADLQEREEIAFALQTGKRKNNQGFGYSCPFGCVDNFETKKDLVEHIKDSHDEGKILLSEEFQSKIFQ